MSLYCNPDDLEKQISKSALIQLTNDNPNQEEIDTVICGEAILYSSTLIDGYLRGKYTLPLNSQFPLLRIIAIDLSIYRLYSRRIYTEIPESVTQAYKNAIKTLEDLKKGIITLQTEEETNVRTTGEYRTNKTELDRLFNKRVMNFEY